MGNFKLGLLGHDEEDPVASHLLYRGYAYVPIDAGQVEAESSSALRTVKIQGQLGGNHEA